MTNGVIKNKLDDEVELSGSMTRFPKYKELFPNDDGVFVLDRCNIETITNLSKVVVNKHFRAYDDFDELVQLGVCSVVDTLNDGKYDKDKGSIKNYLYTSIRNSCTNYIHHNKNFSREVVSDTLPEPLINEMGDLSVSMDLINRYYKYVDTHYTSSITEVEFASYLKHKGFPIDSSILCHRIVDIDAYKYNKLFIKFINFYKDMR